MKKSRILCLMLALVLALGLGVMADAENTQVPELTLLDANGNTVSLSQVLDGKPVVLNVWASWCPPCVAELPHFEQAAKDYEGRVNFMMVNFTDGSRETMAGAKAFLAQNGYTFPVYFDTEVMTYGTYMFGSIPTTWFIYADGTALGYVTGNIAEAETLYEYIDMLLNN